MGKSEKSDTEFLPQQLDSRKLSRVSVIKNFGPIKNAQSEIATALRHVSPKLEKSTKLTFPNLQMKTFPKDGQQIFKENRTQIALPATTHAELADIPDVAKPHLQQKGVVYSSEESINSPEMVGEPMSFTPLEFIALCTVIKTHPIMKTELEAEPEINKGLSRLDDLIDEMPDPKPHINVARTTALHKTGELLLLDDKQREEKMKDLHPDGKIFLAWVITNFADEFPSFVDKYYRNNLLRTKEVQPEDKKALLDLYNELMKKRKEASAHS